jgi:CMP/dCMP kinase
VRSAPFVIALDGPAASGKSTVGLGAARELGLRYFDSGLLYRVLTWLALGRGIDLATAEALERLVDELHVDVDDVGQVWRDGVNVTPELQTPEVDASVSTVSAHAAVRAALVPVQRSLVRGPGLLLAGRDIGTVILPDAPLKIWLNAGVEQRARRRSLQTGEDFENVLAGMRRRDHLDSSREVAPMTRAADAVVVDTDDATVDEVIARIVELARERGAQPAERTPGRA